MEKNHRKNRGFTLIELMIVVGILAVLAAIAIVSYSKWIRDSKNSEATAILADVRIKQEAYRATFHQYANINQWLPGTDPSSSAVKINPMSAAAPFLQWRQLGVILPPNIYFSYRIERGDPGVGPTFFPASTKLETNGDFWFAARAVQDLDDNGACAGFEIYSSSNKMHKLSEGSHCP